MSIDRIMKQFTKLSRQLDEHAKHQDFLVAGLEEDIQNCMARRDSAKAESNRARKIKANIDNLTS